MKYSVHRKLLSEFSKLSKLNAFIFLGNTDSSVLVYNFRPERADFNMYAEYTQLLLTFITFLLSVIVIFRLVAYLAFAEFDPFKTLIYTHLKYIYKIVDTFSCQFLETGTSDRTPIGCDELLKCLDSRQDIWRKMYAYRF